MSLYTMYTILHRVNRNNNNSVDQIVFKKGVREPLAEIKTVDDAINLAPKLGIEDSEDFLYESNITNSYKTGRDDVLSSSILSFPYKTNFLVVEGRMFRLAPHPEAKPFNAKIYAIRLSDSSSDRTVTNLRSV